VATLFYASLIVAYLILGMGSVVSGKFTWIQLPFLIFLYAVWFRAITNFGNRNGMITGSWANAIVQFLMPIVLFSTVIYPKTPFITKSEVWLINR
jgi:uncharacterized membrane protein